MPGTNPALLCRYHYDPLDRLASRSAAGQGSEQCFYQKNRLSTEIQGQIHRSWLQTPGHLLAQRSREPGITGNTLIATDTPGSVLHGISADRQQAYTYAAYGNRHPDSDQLHLPGFNREKRDPVTGHYLLGNGYRAFNPVLMRFNSPDSLSPFGEGGLNAYSYCEGDPVNQLDPSGHFLTQLKRLWWRAFPKKDSTKLTRLWPGVVTYTTKHPVKTLHISAHGTLDPYDLPLKVSYTNKQLHPIAQKNQEPIDPDMLLNRLKEKNIHTSNYQHIDILACFSDLGSSSFRHQIQAKTGIPTTGYKYPITIHPSYEVMINLNEKNMKHYKIRQISKDTYLIRTIPTAING